MVCIFYKKAKSTKINYFVVILCAPCGLTLTDIIYNISTLYTTYIKLNIN